MYLYDTNVISELRRKNKNPNVATFHDRVNKNHQPILLSVITHGEVRFGIQQLRYRGDFPQAEILQRWYEKELQPIEHLAIDFNLDCARVWGDLMAKNPQNKEDKQLVATALVHDLILVTRNVKHIEDCGVRFINPFEPYNF